MSALRFWERQSALSICSALFYSAGCVLSVLSVTIFKSDNLTVGPLRWITAVLSLFAAAMFLMRGRRSSTTLALGLLAVSALFVLSISFIAPTEVRAMNAGLIFTTMMIYLVWFAPMWFARLIGYTWLAVYCFAMTSRFGGESALFLWTLVLTSVLLGELVGAFKNRLDTFSLTDPLCGVWNKRAFDASLAKRVNAAHRGGKPLSLMYFDLDDFKHINDSLGHVEGDRVLREFARTVDAHTRSQDMFARLGGDEFAMVLPDTNAAQAEAVGRRLQELVTEVRCSFGVAELQPGEAVTAFTARADSLMFQEKRQRRAGDGAGR